MTARAMRTVAFVHVPLLLLLACGPIFGAGAFLGAQVPCGTESLDEGIRAYEALELDDATELLSTAVDEARSASPECEALAPALTYLGSTLRFSGRPDSAATVFRTLVLTDPGHRLDSAIFPPAVTELHDSIRARTPAVAVEAPEDVEVDPDRPWTLVLVPSTEHEIRVVVLGPDGSPFREIYRGVVSESGPRGRGTRVAWDGRGEMGRLPEPGRYRLSALSMDSAGVTVRGVDLVFDLAIDDEGRSVAPQVRPGTRWSEWRPAATRAGVGLLGGGLAVGLPGMFGFEGSTTRYWVAGAILSAGVAGAIRALRSDGREELDGASDPVAPTIRVRSGPALRWEGRNGPATEDSTP